MKKAIVYTTVVLFGLLAFSCTEETAQDQVRIEKEQYQDGGQYSGKLEQENNNNN